jgi:hypothetical protein
LRARGWAWPSRAQISQDRRCAHNPGVARTTQILRVLRYCWFDAPLTRTSPGGFPGDISTIIDMSRRLDAHTWRGGDSDSGAAGDRSVARVRPICRAQRDTRAGRTAFRTRSGSLARSRTAGRVTWTENGTTAPGLAQEFSQRHNGLGAPPRWSLFLDRLVADVCGQPLWSAAGAARHRSRLVAEPLAPLPENFTVLATAPRGLAVDPDDLGGDAFSARRRSFQRLPFPDGVYQHIRRHREVRGVEGERATVRRFGRVAH